MASQDPTKYKISVRTIDGSIKTHEYDNIQGDSQESIEQAIVDKQPFALALDAIRKAILQGESKWLTLANPLVLYRVEHIVSLEWSHPNGEQMRGSIGFLHN